MTPYECSLKVSRVNSVLKHFILKPIARHCHIDVLTLYPCIICQEKFYWCWGMSFIIGESSGYYYNWGVSNWKFTTSVSMSLQIHVRAVCPYLGLVIKVRCCLISLVWEFISSSSDGYHGRLIYCQNAMVIDQKWRIGSIKSIVHRNKLCPF